MSTEPYRLTVKIGDSEFSAEGSEATVKEQFALFLTALQYSSPPKKPTSPPVADGATDNEASDHEQNGDGREKIEDIDQATMDRIFAVDSNDLVSLRALPKTATRDADALLMLLYGFFRLTQKGDVFAPTLNSAARQSGVQLDRIDRIIASNSQYINTAGQRRGRRYSLNNQGQVRALELIKDVLQG